MDHRYGRHGPHAWRRWRERRYGRRALSIIQEPHGVIIHLHVSLANVERIIIVMASDQDGKQQEETKGLPPVTIEGSLVEKQISQEDQDRFHTTIWHASEDAKEQSANDIEDDDIKTGVDIERLARTFWSRRRNDPQVINEGRSTRDKDEVARIYFSTFIHRYREETVSKGTSEEIRVRRSARFDQEDDISRGKNLSPLHIRYQAVIRVCTQLDLDTRAESGYLEALDKYVPIYEEIYTRYRRQQGKEVGQSSGPHLFQ